MAVVASIYSSLINKTTAMLNSRNMFVR